MSKPSPAALTPSDPADVEVDSRGEGVLVAPLPVEIQLVNVRKGLTAYRQEIDAVVEKLDAAIEAQAKIPIALEELASAPIGGSSAAKAEWRRGLRPKARARMDDAVRGAQNLLVRLEQAFEGTQPSTGRRLKALRLLDHQAKGTAIALVEAFEQAFPNLEGKLCRRQAEELLSAWSRPAEGPTSAERGRPTKWGVVAEWLTLLFPGEGVTPQAAERLWTRSKAPPAANKELPSPKRLRARR